MPAVCSGSPCRQKKRQKVWTEPSSLPPSRSPLRTSARTVATEARGRKFRKAPSPSSPAVWSIRSRSAAITIGTGRSGGTSSLKPPLPARSPASAARRNSTTSRTRVRGRSNGISFQRSTITFDDDPIPRQKRPPESCCIEAACWASTAGPRVNTFTTPVPTRIRSVAVAASATGVKPSWPDTSPGQPSVKPASSAARSTGPASASERPGKSSESPQRRVTDRHAIACARGASLPPLFRSRPIPVQVLFAAGVPAAFGALCGWVLGLSEIAYLILSLLALIGAYVAGREHVGGWEAALRGAVAGAFFGGALLLVHTATGKAPKVDLPDPKILLLAVTVGASAIACGFGGADRKSMEEREDGPQGFSLKRLHWSEPLGFLASAILLFSLWLPWFSTSSSNPNSKIGTAGI